MVFQKFKNIILNKNKKPLEQTRLATRAFEENKIIQILAKSQKNNCIVVGRQGVGKTSLLQSLKKRIKKSVIVIDDVHLLKNEEALSLKEKIINKDIQCLLSTTYVAYKSYNDYDAFFAQNFTPILLAEPNNDEALEILDIKSKELEDIYNISILPTAFQPLIELSQRYLFDKNMPASFVDVLDEICASKSVIVSQVPSELSTLIDHIASLKSQTLSAAQKIELNALEIKYNKLHADWQQNQKQKKIIEPKDIYQYFQQVTNAPLKSIETSFKQKINTLEANLNNKVLHQSQAVTKISNAIKKKFLEDAYKKGKPLSLLFTGPNGVGKYKTCKELAKLLFDDVRNLVIKPTEPYQVVVTDNPAYAYNKGLKNSILIYKQNHDFIDEVINFDTLERRGARDIAKSMISDLVTKIAINKVLLNIEEQVYMFIINKSYTTQTGVAAMRAVIEAELKDKIQELVAKANLSNKTIYIYFEHGGLEVKAK